MASRQDASTGEVVKDKSPSESSEHSLRVKIYAPFHTYYDGEAESISAVNDTGPFDVLLGHKNFLSLLSPCEIVVRRSGADDEKFKIAKGIMHVSGNKVTVFLDV